MSGGLGSSDEGVRIEKSKNFDFVPPLLGTQILVDNGRQRPLSGWLLMLGLLLGLNTPSFSGEGATPKHAHSKLPRWVPTMTPYLLGICLYHYELDWQRSRDWLTIVIFFLVYLLRCFTRFNCSRLFESCVSNKSEHATPPLAAFTIISSAMLIYISVIHFRSTAKSFQARAWRVFRSKYNTFLAITATCSAWPIIYQQSPIQESIPSRPTTHGEHMVVLAGRNDQTLDFRGYEELESIKQFFLYESERMNHNLSEWLKNLSPVTEGPNRPSEMYSGCYILSLAWEDDEFDCHAEAEALMQELEDRWGTSGIVYKIPRMNSQRQLQREVELAVSKFIKKYDGDSNLLLIHYGGHGIIGKGREYILGMGQQKIFWAPIRNLLLSCKSDVAIFMDACFAAAAVYRRSYKHTVELIGCPEKTVTPGFGPRTFTKALTQALQKHTKDQLELRYLDLEVQTTSQDQVDRINGPREANPRHYTMRRSARGYIVMWRRSLLGTDGTTSS